MKIDVNVTVTVGRKKFSLTPEEIIELRDKLIKLTEYYPPRYPSIPLDILNQQHHVMIFLS